MEYGIQYLSKWSKHSFFFLLLYLIGQVFVKYALRMLAWMPEVCPSANYSIELR